MQAMEEETPKRSPDPLAPGRERFRKLKEEEAHLRFLSTDKEPFRVWISKAFQKHDGRIPFVLWPARSRTPEKVVRLEKERAVAWLARLQEAKREESV